MGLLAAVRYDPASLPSTATTATLKAMTVFDSTNAAVSFNAPANGRVLVHLSCTQTGAAQGPATLLGVMQHTGGTVIARRAPMIGAVASGAGVHSAMTTVFPVAGLTAGALQTWDAGYAVQVLATSSLYNWGGPDDATAANAFGALVFEVWDARNLLGVATYDPAAAVTHTVSAALVQTAMDTTNLRATFIAPTSGNVFVRCSGGPLNGSTGAPAVFLGALEGATKVGRVTPTISKGQNSTQVATDLLQNEAGYSVTGVTAGSHNYDLAYGVDVVQTMSFKYGGPNDTTGADAFGMAFIEVWDAT